MTDRDDELQDQAAEWIGRLRRPVLEPKDRQDFAAWIATNLEHRAAFDAVMATWDRLGVLRRANVASLGLAPATRSWWIRGWRPFALASLALGVLILGFWPQRPPLTDMHTIAGELRTLTLDDGTVVEANTATVLAYRLDRSERFIQLTEGEAFFQVAHDSVRPFRVRTRDGVVTATGTAFSVEQRKDGSRLALTEGTVEVAPDSAAAPRLRITAPALLLFTANETRRVTGAAENAVAWRNRQLIYDQVTLAELIDDLNRYMPTRVTVTNAQLAERRVSAVLHLGDQVATLNALARILNLRWEKVAPDRILLSPNV